MKPHKQPLRYSLIAVGLLLLATGFTISKIRTPPNRTENISPTSEIHQSSRSPHPTSSELHRTLTSIDTQLGPERLLRLIATIAGSNLDTLPDLANHFTNDGAALKLITLHWLNLDPNHCLNFLIESRMEQEGGFSFALLYHLSERWIAEDLSAFVSAIEKLPLQARQWWGFIDRYCDIVEIDYRLGFRLMRGAELTGLSANSSQVDQLAGKQPKKLADDLPQLTSGFALTHALQQVAHEWAKSEPEEALAYAATIPGQRGLLMSSQALTSWTTLHPEAAATWLTDHPNARIQDELRPSLLRAWSKKDPEAAHQYGLTNLTGFRQRQALRLIEPDEIPK
ncbi:MAG: hypothetical protein ACJAQT_005082 [Akkermansiaceae bacterium]|jgi:hypothetical protein